jgi:lipid-binding SYLF domain-containing protein
MHERTLVLKASILSFILLFTINVFADESRDKVVSRVQDAATVLDEIMSAPDKGIPEEVIGSAECVAVVPSLLKGGFVFGAEYGRGVATCRNPNGWSAPAFFRIGGGSFGLQIGGQAVDLVMLVMNQRGMQALLADHVKLGADASAAAGPVGRHAEGMTDWKMRAEVLTYSRARGLFAGVTLNGAVVEQDRGDARSFYGRMISFKRLLTGEIPAPADAKPFLETVEKYNATKNEPEKAAETKAATPESAAAAKPADSTTTKSDAAAPATAPENTASTAKPSPAQEKPASSDAATPSSGDKPPNR